MRLTGDALFVGTFVGFVVFSILYTIAARWWHNPAGRNVLAFMVVCSVLMGLGVLRMIVGADWFDANRDWLRMLCYGALFVVVWWRVGLLFKLQFQGEEVREAEQDHREVGQNLRELNQNIRESSQNERDRLMEDTIP